MSIILAFFAYDIEVGRHWHA